MVYSPSELVAAPVLKSLLEMTTLAPISGSPFWASVMVPERLKFCEKSVEKQIKIAEVMYLILLPSVFCKKMGVIRRPPPPVMNDTLARYRRSLLNYL